MWISVGTYFPMCSRDKIRFYVAAFCVCLCSKPFFFWEMCFCSVVDAILRAIHVRLRILFANITMYLLCARIARSQIPKIFSVLFAIPTVYQ